MPGTPGQSSQTDLLRATLRAVAPGTELRDAIERILRGRTGALIVLGFGPALDAICSGGFELDVPFSATRVRELAKMDGAVILDFGDGSAQGSPPSTTLSALEAQASADGAGAGPQQPATGARFQLPCRIVRAAVQMLPDPSIPTTESGTRHRTAERVAKQTGYPVISVSQSMRTAALYVGDVRHVLLDPEELSARAKQALDTLESYRSKLEEVSAQLAALEVEDQVTVRDVAAVAGRQEMVWRIGIEISALLGELGTAGRLLRMQFEELILGVKEGRLLLTRDYATSNTEAEVEADLAALAALPAASLIEPEPVALAMELAAPATDPDNPISPRGYALLARVPGMTNALANAIVAKFGSLQAILGAPLQDLIGVHGLTPVRARIIREGLSRVAETATLERFV